MATTYPLLVGRTRRMKESGDESAVQELAMKLRGQITAGQDAPTTSTQGALYVQWAADSYSRVWIKCSDGVWR